MKLKTHPITFSEEEVIVNIDLLAKDKFVLKDGDIIEVLPVEGQGLGRTTAAMDQSNASGPGAGEDREDKPRLVLQVKQLPSDIQVKGGPLSIISSLAQAFSLSNVREVSVQKVDKESVKLDLIELVFKDQALTRSDMWRFTCSLIGSCVHVLKKLEFAGIRAQVDRLWTMGGNTQSGVILDSSRVLFRSASAQVFLFIQISTEMWEFDLNGDMYFDKAVNLLKELFQQWKEKSCNHKVNVIFFWRVYYDSRKEALPSSLVRTVIQKKGRMYQDYYKVITEKSSALDWLHLVLEIKRHFIQLPEFFKKKNITSDPGSVKKLSASTQGNVLEAINLALNVFNRDHIDVNFLLTGHQVILITAGVGVFEVDHELSRITKERAIDQGTCVDLLCLTEQPLHAVPLFMFRRESECSGEEEHFYIPHWINYSFYSPPNRHSKSLYRPILKLSDHLVNHYLKQSKEKKKKKKVGQTKLFIPASIVSSADPLVRVDYEEYDSKVFRNAKAMEKTFTMTPVVRKRIKSQNAPFSSSYRETSGVKFQVAGDSTDEGEEEME